MVMATVSELVAVAVAAELEVAEVAEVVEADDNKEGQRQQGWTDDSKDYCDYEVMMVRRRRTPKGTYEAWDKENYCCHEVMLMMLKKRRKKRSRTATTSTLLGTVHTPYRWIGNSYSSSSIQERRGRCRGIIFIRMGPIGRYVIHRVQHMILIATL